MPQSFPHSFVNTDVREVFENHSIEETQQIYRKINHEIERKREELRMLVGERYRDLIDAADTIGTMKTSSVRVFQKLSALRTTLNGLPNQLTMLASNNNKGIDHRDDRRKLTRAELEVAVELKLSLDIPREVHHYLEREEVIPALHLTLLFTRRLVCNEEKYKWTFLEASGSDVSDSVNVNLENMLVFCESGLNSSDTSYQKLAECILVKQIITESSVETILSTWLSEKVNLCQSALRRQDSAFLSIVGSTVQGIYQIFMDSELYNTTMKTIRKFRIDPSIFGLRFTPAVVAEYNSKTIPMEEPPRVSRLAKIVNSVFVAALKQTLEEQTDYLSEFSTLAQLQEYRQNATKVLKEHCEDLIRIVLGPSTNIWTHVFHPVFQRRAEMVAKGAIDEIINFLSVVGFPKFQTADATFDLMPFIWKASGINSDGSPADDNLKLKGLTPSISQLCEDLEFRFSELLIDFQAIGDSSLKEFISTVLLAGIDAAIQVAVAPQSATTEKGRSNSSFGRFATGLIELCPTLWKLLEKNDRVKLKQRLSTQSEDCWRNWTEILLQTFSSELEKQMGSLTPQNVVGLMPMAETYTAESSENGETFVPSVRVPVELTHTLHSVLFSICIELSKVGPQCIPKSVKDSLRVALAKSIVTFYEKLTETGEEHFLTAQMALQFVFDLKFIQWFHSSLSGTADEIVQKLKSLIDPFDWDIVNPRLTLNLKRFLFENQLTMGLLFSEESHGFIAQNFKTKRSLSFPTPKKHLLYNQLPLLPV